MKRRFSKKVTMKVIVAGFQKTGTKSMNSALTTLGFKVYDVDQHLICHGREWIKIFTEGGSKEDFYQMYKDTDAVVDIPASFFWEEILKAFPEAKVVLTTRDEESWMCSFKKQMEEIENNWMLLLCCLLTLSGRRLREVLGLTGRVFQGASECKFLSMKRNWNEMLTRKMYRTHNAAVLMRAPKNQRLAYNIKDGWEPLCEFLGKPIPKVPFPHKNKKGAIVDDYMKNNPLFLQLQYEAKVALAIIIGLLSMLVWIVMWAYSSW